MKQRGRPPVLNRATLHSVYLDAATWKWLQSQKDGASAAIRSLVSEKRLQEVR